MSDAVYVELPEQPKPAPFWRTRRGLAIIIFVLLILAAAVFSWWLAQGKISSSMARLDTLVYTVGTEYPTQIRDVYTHAGDIVAAGQPLASMEGTAYAPQSGQAAGEIAQLRQRPGMQGIAERLSAAQKAEQEMTAKLAQARATEEQFRQRREERVTEHVRSQLVMRSINRQHVGAYEQASQAERAARARMEAANVEFEQVSRARAAMGVELDKIRNDIARTRRRANLADNTQAIANRQVPAAPKEEYLYAPVNGRVLRVSAMRGQSVQQGQTIFYILPTGDNQKNDYWIQAWFPLRDKPKLKVGQKVTVRFENMGLHLDGKVDAVSADAQIIPRQQNDAGSVNLDAVSSGEKAEYGNERYIPVKIVLDDPAQAASIEPGTRAECQIQTRYLLGL